MLTLAQVQSLHDSVMLDEVVLTAAAPIMEADDIEARIVVAERLAQMVILITLDKLSEIVSDIPSAAQLSAAVIEKTVNDFADFLDTL